tara:strand:+ start:92 stop:967 length:876 start_codon:yes stop_codon:yes gene_type:complete
MALTQIKTTGIADDAVTSAKIPNDAITSALIADDAITSALIADDAITSALIADDAVVAAAIADDAIGSAAIADDAVVTAAIADNAVTAPKTDLSIVQGDVIYGTGTDAWARLAKGTADQVLTMNSGATAPEWQTGGYAPVHFTRAWYDSYATQESNIDKDTGAHRVGGTNLEIVWTPPSTSARYLVWATLHYRFDGGGQWGWTCKFTSNNWTSDSNFGMHNSMSYETPDAVNRRPDQQLWHFHPNTTNECKLGMWVQIWYPHSGTIDVNASNQKSKLYLFELPNNTSFSGI